MKQVKCSKLPPPAGKVTQATLHKLQLFIPKHYLFCNACRQTHNFTRKGTDKNMLETVQWQQRNSLRHFKKPAEQFLLGSALGEEGKMWRASSGRSLQLTYTNIYIFNLLPRHASVPQPHYSLLGQGREYSRARQGDKRYHYATDFIWVQLTGLISLLICITKVVSFAKPKLGFSVH